MTTCNESDRYLSSVLAGLVVMVTVVLGALTHAVASSSAFV